MLVRQDLLEKNNFFVASVQFPLSNPASTCRGKNEKFKRKIEITYVGRVAYGGV